MGRAMYGLSECHPQPAVPRELVYVVPAPEPTHQHEAPFDLYAYRPASDFPPATSRAQDVVNSRTAEMWTKVYQQWGWGAGMIATRHLAQVMEVR